MGIALVALAAACGGQSAAPLSDKQLAKLVLQSDELPGLEKFGDGREVGSELSPVLGDDPHRFDRQKAWVVRYRRRGNPKVNGPLLVASTVESFGGSSGASKYFSAVRDRETETNAASGLTRVETPEIGDGTYAFASPRAPRGTVRSAAITWRDGRFVATVAASGFAERMSVGDVVALARRQEKRLAAAS